MRITKKYAEPDIEIIALGTNDIIMNSQNAGASGGDLPSSLTPYSSNEEGLGLNEFTY